MNDEEIIALAKKYMPFNFSGPQDGRELLAFARAIADIQKEKDAAICDELSLCKGNGKATTPGGACLECGDAIRYQKEPTK